MANVNIKLGYKNLAWFNANPTIVLLVGQIVYLDQTGTYKIGDGVTSLSSLSFLGSSSSGVQSVTGAQVDNTDPLNPVVGTPNLQEVTAATVTITNPIITKSTINVLDASSNVVDALDELGLTITDSTNANLLLEVDRVNDTVKVLGVEVATVNDLVSLYVTARNNTGSTILKGQIVYVSGALGQNPTIALAKADIEATSFDIGIAAFDIPNNTNVQNNICTNGLVESLNTIAFADGDLLYLSPTTAGLITNVPTTTPNFSQFVGFCLHSHITLGKILVKTAVPIATNTTISTSNKISPSSNAVKFNLDLKADKLNSRIANDFRLTLTSGVAVTTGDVVNATTIYCTPLNGNKISLYDGSNWITYSSAEFSLALGALTNNVLYDVFCYANTGVPTLELLAWSNTKTRATALVLQDGILVKLGATTRKYLGSFYNQGNKSATVTITNASPAVITYTAHGLTSNSPVVFTTTGGLPSGIVAGQTYYLASLGTATVDTFNISATPGGALINTSTAGSGTHTATISTYTEDSKANRYLWNYYNQAPRKMSSFSNETTHTYTLAVHRPYSNNILNQLNFIQGLDNIISAIFKTRVTNSTINVGVIIGIGLDYNNAIGANASTLNIPTTAGNPTTIISNFDDYTGIGKSYLSALEYSSATGTTTWYSTNGTYMSIQAILLG